ncbi:hypothetical protein AB3N61_06445 [Leptospira sp. WS58.C1]|uniref:hypothetical protein n=1 Tax=Leptospira cinconiae TaxID=3235173 RepID=UPI00349EC160
MNLILSLLNNKLNNAGVKIENLNGAKLARLDIFRNLILEEKYSKYFSILSLLHFPRTKKTIRYGSSVYYKNPGKRASFEAIVYDKAEQLKSLSNYDSVGPENILRMEFRYYGTRWISEQFKKFVFFYKFLDPKFPYFTYLENFDCDKFFRSKANKLLKPILNFDHLPSSTSLQNELEIFFKGKNSINPRKEALLARTLLKINEKGLLEEFIRRNEFKIMRLSFKSGTSQSRRKRIKERAYKLLITAGLMKEIILHGYDHINELKQGLLEKRKNPRKRAA